MTYQEYRDYDNSGTNDFWEYRGPEGWESHYGLRSGYAGSAFGTDSTENDPVHGIGFGPGDLRKARRAGYTAMSILEYLKGQSGVSNANQGLGISPYQQAVQNRHGSGSVGVVPQSVINQLRDMEATERGLARGYQRYLDRGTRIGDIETNVGDLESDVSENTINTEVNSRFNQLRQQNPYAVTNSSAMGIQSAQSPAQIAGMLRAGLGGLSRSNREFTNNTINV